MTADEREVAAFVAYVNSKQFLYAEVVDFKGYDGVPPAVNLWLRGFQNPDATVVWPRSDQPAQIVWGHHWEHSHPMPVTPGDLLTAVEQTLPPLGEA